MKPYLTILSLLALVIIGAAGDALNDTGVKIIGHIMEAVEVGGLLVVGLAFNLKRKDIIALLATYACLRIFGFDYVYNIVAGLPLSYHGGSSLWDGFLSKFPQHGILFSRAIILLVGISIPFKFLR